MKTFLLRSAAATMAILAAFTTAAHAQGFGPIADFMVMDVCTGPDGQAVSGIPGDKGCQRHRDIAPGETPPYTLQNFPAPTSGCAAGPVSKINVPVSRFNETRIISSTLRQIPCGATDPDSDDDLERNGASIQWHDDAYGFIMGSYSPVSLSSFESDLCGANRETSRRFFRGWVIGPADVPALGATGYGVFQTKLQKGAASANMGACALRYTRALTTWAVEKISYTSGRALVSVVSSHYSRGAPDGESPGDAMQMEQTFWTREFGLSRWEKWAREDWVHPRSGKSARDLAAQLVAAGRCSPPVHAPLTFTPAMQMSGTENGADLYSRVISNPLTGEQHTWVMTLCEDYTNISPLADGGKVLARVSTLADDGYWE
ncbi:hypothetical protein LRX75_00945 [Rhizobium sp. DKSPLA3]|uniref:DUF2599 domain-containing protein n=1 Tax=Rhizobium quercicola TaxID=2901226 RepID=A0A9X1NPE5_9HYPH|nr:hypothetical protein [Rhizobium quercicola]MCD7107594.1 hypothetical protein [Rhizobium quercicola]